MEDSMEKINCRDKIYTPIKSNKRNSITREYITKK